jgi:hypothetical protein
MVHAIHVSVWHAFHTVPLTLHVRALCQRLLVECGVVRLR